MRHPPVETLPASCRSRLVASVSVAAPETPAEDYQQKRLSARPLHRVHARRRPRELPIGASSSTVASDVQLQVGGVRQRADDEFVDRDHAAEREQADRRALGVLSSERGTQDRGGPDLGEERRHRVRVIGQRHLTPRYLSFRDCHDRAVRRAPDKIGVRTSAIASRPGAAACRPRGRPRHRHCARVTRVTPALARTPQPRPDQARGRPCSSGAPASLTAAPGPTDDQRQRSRVDFRALSRRRARRATQEMQTTRAGPSLGQDVWGRDARRLRTELLSGREV